MFVCNYYVHVCIASVQKSFYIQCTYFQGSLKLLSKQHCLVVSLCLLCMEPFPCWWRSCLQFYGMYEVVIG